MSSKKGKQKKFSKKAKDQRFQKAFARWQKRGELAKKEPIAGEDFFKIIRQEDV